MENHWAEFNASFAGLTEAQMLAPGITSAWSVKDIIAHVSTWEEEALKNLPLILQNQKLPRYKNQYGGLDAFNAQMTDMKRSFSLSDILKQSDTIHRQLTAFLNSVPEEMFTFRNPLPPPPAVGYLQPLPDPCQSNSGMAGKLNIKYQAFLFSTCE